jgi:crotonobetainyl-CoA:carnitine CoA-transferase CaiB-like acyl-CoA transferase
MSTGERAVTGPLAGLRVLDLTVALAGAFTTMLLADLGADVIKVDSLQHYSTPSRGPRRPAEAPAAVFEAMRRDYAEGDPGPDPWNRISWFNAHARNKRDITMDLTRERGRELFLRLVEQSDGFVENNPPGVLEKLGIGPDVLLARNPRLIVVRMPPLGLSGPDHRTTGFGWHFEDLAGVLRVQGYPDGPEVGSILMDGTSGPAGANAFLLALLRRHRTGEGGVVEVAQVENLVNHLGDLTLGAAMTGATPPRWGNRDGEFVPQGVYRAAGDDEWLALSVRSDQEWVALVTVVGDERLGRPDWATVEGRRRDHDEIDAVLTGWSRTRAPMDAAAALQNAGIPAGPVLDEAAALSDPHLHERGFFVLLEHPSAGTHFHPGTNMRLGGTPLGVRRAAPTLGQDNDDVYRGLLGLGDAEIAELVADGHIGTGFV